MELRELLRLDISETKRLQNHSYFIRINTFFSRTALMYVYMGQMKYEHTKPYEDWFWEKNRIELKYDKLESINIERKNLQLTKELLEYDQLILATGSNYNTLPNINPDIKGVQGLYHLQDLEKLEENTKNIKKQ